MSKSLDDADHPMHVNNMINRMGIYMTPLFVVVAFWVNALWIWAHWGNDSDIGGTWDLEWGGMGLHPYLMMTAYMVCNPLAICTFRLVRDMMGFSHTVAKYIHAFLQTAALVLAILGVVTMKIFLTSMDEDNWGSTHSMIGLMMVVLWGFQVGMSIMVFIMPFTPGWIRAAYHQLHMVLGYCFSFGVLVVLIMGIVYEEAELDTWGSAAEYESDWINDWKRMKTGCIAVFYVMFVMYLALYRRPEARS